MSMSKPELARRQASCKPGMFAKACAMVRQGYGAHGITLECDVTLKQANAAHEWVNRYGGIVPPHSVRVEVLGVAPGEAECMIGCFGLITDVKDGVYIVHTGQLRYDIRATQIRPQ